MKNKLIEQITQEIIAMQRTVPIPVAISNRHVHLNEQAKRKLFGDDPLIIKKNLTQPREFAAVETVKVIGPKRHFDSVRVVGPLRSKCQVEVSIADCYHLGIDPVIRDSGKLNGTPGIYLVGPRGVVKLEEGVMVAQRHIHMTTNNAKKFGVNDSDLVRIRFNSGPRRGILGDVVVRVSNNYSLECHLDIEEANALGIKNNDTAYMEIGGI